MQVLHIDSSILGDASASRILTAAIVDELRRENPDAIIARRDLAVEAIPHLDGAIAAGFRATGSDDFDDATRAEHARSEALVNELLASDVIVVGAPMYNFSVPSQLKAWVDRVAQAGRTFKYTEKGPAGLAGGKKVIVASTRGGVYSTGPAAGLDFQEAYLKAVFGFFGITDVQFVRAEGLAMGPDARTQAMEAAHTAMRDVVNQAVAA
ncbi:FMN-dependent NADH-azoreductase [Ralstonia insidiosa]|jgi:FMN-dependent NADH-azoreductase|uniref:FMN-dependent NADH-azoreductase n=1 Tax=Ralstonia TaxID=48736 RepID=UPI000664C468|nr:FMN-dependent NADH-azoreductase [Ralstonia insidiosa]KMW44262.1 FMN-dependent NADH-azoreductase [Ralstonia sp. MD27]MBX3771428.1 FMN-dependent NADH-azoreductase [Ralstonia pickettii]NOZ18759.1 FMN-dependent NADH-azoreductase [Betaproteobacteria bacterium]MBA9855326.1 FMN-dependent NADH-azoreductase [Ralstonia insidiosa]MBA9869438.1 FMN-dependent NADH-azoreductase [Ralstonia insidiosa]